MSNNAHISASGLILCALTLLLPLPAGAVTITFLERLANFDGIQSMQWAKITVDEEHKEVFTLDQRDQAVRIYDQHGMEIFNFGDNVRLAGASDLDLGEEGNIYLVFPRDDEQIMRLDYKGERLASLELTGIPEDFAPFNPQVIQVKDGNLYLADSTSFNVVVADNDGTFIRGYHLLEPLLRLREDFSGRPGGEALSDPQELKSLEFFGFWADRDDNFFFTVPTIFAAFKYTTDGELKSFGAPGSAPGKFGVASGITTDDNGNIYVTDRLRSVVMIFDRNFEFQQEFGYRGYGPGNLIVPDDVVVDERNGLIFVAQAANRGVSVYRMSER